MATIYPVASSPWPSGSSNPSPDYSGVFIPTIWSGKLIEKFYDASVIPAIANTDYEGEISSYGDKVVIRQSPNISINAYEAEQSLVFERPSASTVELTIDKGFYFNTILDDVMEVQSDLDLLSMWSDDASEQMKIQIDTEVLDNAMMGTAAAANRGATAGRISGDIDLGITTAPLTLEAATGGSNTNVIDFITRMGQVLDEQNVPETGRWMIVPAWLAAMIKRSELKDASLAGDTTSIVRNGRLGSIDRFTIYLSNLLPDASHASLTTGEFAVFAGHSSALTFASQMSKVETLRGESTFGTIMRGLQVYGRKVVKPESLVQAVVTSV